MVFQPGEAVRFVGKHAIELGLEGVFEKFLEVRTGRKTEGNKMATKQKGTGRLGAEGERLGAGFEFGDARERFGRVQGGASVVVCAHDDAELGDGRRGEFPGEAADAVVGKIAVTAVVREVEDDQRTDVLDEFAGSADAGEKRLGERAAGGFMAGADPAELAATLGE